MKLSARRKNEIKWEAEKCFLSVLRNDHLGHNESWWDNNPETWSREQKEHFDALGDLKDKIVQSVFKIFEPHQ